MAPGIYMFEINNGNPRTISEPCLKLTIKILEQRQWHCSGVFIGNFEQISDIVPIFVALTLDKQMSTWIKLIEV